MLVSSQADGFDHPLYKLARRQFVVRVLSVGCLTAALLCALGPAHSQETPAPSVTVSGLLDMYYSHNFNRTLDRANPYRGFDVEDRSFALSLIELIADKTPSPLGFHVRLAGGKTADIVHSAEPGGPETVKHIMQAYGTYACDPEGRLVMDAGKFVTPHGAEVIETSDNWNYSRGLLFTWAIPFYHMGLRAKYKANSRTTVSAYLVNGWNNVSENNKGKTVGLQASWTDGNRLSVTHSWMGGSEQKGRSGNWRHLWDTLVTYKLSDKLTIAVNHDYAFEKIGAGTVKWTGAAGYIRRDIGPARALTLRAEWFRDRDGFSTGTAQTLRELTLTYEVRPHNNLITRCEVRRDWSTKAVFPKGTDLSKAQTTFLVGTVGLF
ncbi:MAG: porin [Armatimonadota bacterium]